MIYKVSELDQTVVDKLQCFLCHKNFKIGDLLRDFGSNALLKYFKPSPDDFTRLNVEGDVEHKIDKQYCLYLCENCFEEHRH